MAFAFHHTAALPSTPPHGFHSESHKSTSTHVLLVHILPFLTCTKIDSCCLRIPGESPDLPSSLSKTIVEPQASAQPGVAHFCVWRNLDIVSSMSTTVARPNHFTAGQHESLTRCEMTYDYPEMARALFRQVKTRCHVISTSVNTALNVLPPYQASIRVTAR